MKEIWINSDNNMVEVSWDEDGQACFYRKYPRTGGYRKWDGFITRNQLIEKDYSYYKDSNE